MAENTEEPYPGDPLNTPPATPPAEIMPTDNTAPSSPSEPALSDTDINQQPSTEQMEVHKHPHHVMHKKKWGEYFLEFFMLFLAVFLGFVAENIREHFIENNRAKEYSISLLEDLKNDTTAINNQKKYEILYISMADSLLEISKTTLADRNAAKFSFYTRFVYWTTPISWNRNTFEQIKSSGSLRYFKNAPLLKKLLQYDNIINDINSEGNANTARGSLLLPLINSIIDPALNQQLSKYFLVTLDRMSDDAREHLFSYKTASLENKREPIKQLLNMVIVQQRNMQLQVDTRWPKVKALATELISDINKAYPQE